MTRTREGGGKIHPSGFGIEMMIFLKKEEEEVFRCMDAHATVKFLSIDAASRSNLPFGTSDRLTDDDFAQTREISICYLLSEAPLNFGASTLSTPASRVNTTAWKKMGGIGISILFFLASIYLTHFFSSSCPKGRAIGHGEEEETTGEASITSSFFRRFLAE